jgi:hypothetical protein
MKVIFTSLKNYSQFILPLQFGDPHIQTNF